MATQSDLGRSTLLEVNCLLRRRVALPWAGYLRKVAFTSSFHALMRCSRLFLPRMLHDQIWRRVRCVSQAEMNMCLIGDVLSSERFVCLHRRTQASSLAACPRLRGAYLIPVAEITAAAAPPNAYARREWPQSRSVLIQCQAQKCAYLSLLTAVLPLRALISWGEHRRKTIRGLRFIRNVLRLDLQIAARIAPPQPLSVPAKDLTLTEANGS